MELTGKQKRFLRGLSNGKVNEIVIGHGGLSDNFFTNLESALCKDELIKIRLQPATGLEVNDTAKLLSGQSKSEVVQVFGRTILIYRKNSKKGKILLPE